MAVSYYVSSLNTFHKSWLYYHLSRKKMFFLCLNDFFIGVLLCMIWWSISPDSVCGLQYQHMMYHVEIQALCTYSMQDILKIIYKTKVHYFNIFCIFFWNNFILIKFLMQINGWGCSCRNSAVIRCIGGILNLIFIPKFSPLY